MDFDEVPLEVLIQHLIGEMNSEEDIKEVLLTVARSVPIFMKRNRNILMPYLKTLIRELSDAKHLQSFDYLLHEPHEVFTKQLYFTPSLLATFLLGSFDHHHHLLEANDHLGNFGPEFARAVLIARVIHKHMPFKEYQDVEVGKLLSALFRLADRGQRKILLQGFSLLILQQRFAPDTIEFPDISMKVVEDCVNLAKLQDPERPPMNAQFLESMLLSTLEPIWQRFLLTAWLVSGKQQNRCRDIVMEQFEISAECCADEPDTAMKLTSTLSQNMLSPMMELSKELDKFIESSAYSRVIEGVTRPACFKAPFMEDLRALQELSDADLVLAALNTAFTDNRGHRITRDTFKTQFELVPKFASAKAWSIRLLPLLNTGDNGTVTSNHVDDPNASSRQSVSLSVRQKSLLKMSNEFVDYLNRIDNTETLLSKLASSADVFWRNKPGSQNCYLQQLSQKVDSRRLATAVKHLLYQRHESFARHLECIPEMLAAVLLGSFDNQLDIFPMDGIGPCYSAFIRALLVVAVMQKQLPGIKSQDSEVRDVLGALFREAKGEQRKTLLYGFDLLIVQQYFAPHAYAEHVLISMEVVAECTLMAKLHNFERPGSLPTITASFLESMVLSMMCPRLQVVFLSMWLLCGEQQLSCSSIIEDLSTLSQGSGLSEETPFTNIPQITELMEGFAFMYKTSPVLHGNAGHLKLRKSTSMHAMKKPVTKDDLILAALNIVFTGEDGSPITRETFESQFELKSMFATAESLSFELPKVDNNAAQVLTSSPLHHPTAPLQAASPAQSPEPAAKRAALSEAGSDRAHKVARLASTSASDDDEQQNRADDCNADQLMPLSPAQSNSGSAAGQKRASTPSADEPQAKKICIEENATSPAPIQVAPGPVPAAAPVPIQVSAPVDAPIVAAAPASAGSLASSVILLTAAFATFAPATAAPVAAAPMAAAPVAAAPVAAAPVAAAPVAAAPVAAPVAAAPVAAPVAAAPVAAAPASAGSLAASVLLLTAAFATFAPALAAPVAAPTAAPVAAKPVAAAPVAAAPVAAAPVAAAPVAAAPVAAAPASAAPLAASVLLLTAAFAAFTPAPGASAPASRASVNDSVPPRTSARLAEKREKQQKRKDLEDQREQERRQNAELKKQERKQKRAQRMQEQRELPRLLCPMAVQVVLQPVVVPVAAPPPPPPAVVVPASLEPIWQQYNLIPDRVVGTRRSARKALEKANHKIAYCNRGWPNTW